MSLTPTQLSVPPKSRFRATTVAVLATVAFGTLFALTTASEFLADANTTTVILAALIFFALMVFAAAYGRASSQPCCLVLDFHGHLGQRVGVLAVVVSAEQQLAATWEQHAHVCGCPAPVAQVAGG